MTLYELQKDLANEVEHILQNMVLKDVDGNNAHIKAFLQSLPKRIQNVQDNSAEENDDMEGDIMSGEDIIQDQKTENDPYPYCIVMLASGNMDMVQEAQQTKTMLIFGIYNDDIQCLGHQTLINIMHKIAERFIKNPILNNQYQMNYEAGIQWALDDEDRYPYYFGAMEMTWDAFFVGREEDRYV